MDPTTMTFGQWVLIGAIAGFVLGLIPLITGFIKRRARLGVVGFVTSIAGGSLFGLLLAAPIAAVFTWLVFRKPKTSPENP